MTERKDLRDLVAAPIQAINEAELSNALRFVDLFTESACVECDSVDPATPGRRFRELTFEVDGRDEQGQAERRQVRLPLFQMAPIGGVSIERAKLKYALEVEAQSTEGTDGPRLLASIARQPSADATMHRADGSPAPGVGNLEVEIELRQIDLPGGFLDLLEHTRGGAVTAAPTGPMTGGHPDDAPGEELWKPDELFRVEIRGLDELVLEPGTEFEAVMDLRVDRRLTGGEPVEIEIEAYPPSALHPLEPDRRFQISDDSLVPLRLHVSPRVAEYSPRARVGLRLTATVSSRAASRKEFVRLPHKPHTPNPSPPPTTGVHFVNEVHSVNEHDYYW